MKCTMLPFSSDPVDGRRWYYYLLPVVEAELSSRVIEEVVTRRPCAFDHAVCSLSNKKFCGSTGILEHLSLRSGGRSPCRSRRVASVLYYSCVYGVGDHTS
jgi:hypothetical protein